MSDYRVLRHELARRLEAGGITNPRVLDAFRRVPRDRFVREALRSQSYADRALPIASGQTISQPSVIAHMLEMLDPGPSDSVLEVGTGSGYQTALLALLAARVYSLERISALTRTAIRRIAALDLDNVKVQTFDGTIGWSQVGPFDRIIVAAAAPGAPRPLLEQLAEGGRMVIPEGSRQEQLLTLYTRRDGEVTRTRGERVAFVPLLGRHGWSNEEDS